MERFLPPHGVDRETHRQDGSIADIQLAISGIRLANFGNRLGGPYGHIEDVLTYRNFTEKIVTDADVFISGSETIQSTRFQSYFPTPPTLYRGNAIFDGNTIERSLVSGSMLIGNNSGINIAELSASRDDSDELEFEFRRASLPKDLPKKTGIIVSPEDTRLLLTGLLQCRGVDAAAQIPDETLFNVLTATEIDNEAIFRMLLMQAAALTAARSASYEWEDEVSKQARALHVHDKTSITSRGTTDAYHVAAVRNLSTPEARSVEQITARYTDVNQEGYTARLLVGVSGRDRTAKSAYFSTRRAAYETGTTFERTITDACTHVADLTSSNVHRTLPAFD